ncbi:MAG: hypothetical protein V4463_11055 [Pseudomonadota bacterium]
MTTPLASLLMLASALIILGLGSMHLLLTFRGQALHPRDAALQARLKEVPLVLTRETTMWRAWIGFNASHSFGAMLFGLVYGYLALAHTAMLFASTFLLVLGLVLLSGYVFLARRYWFRIPFRGIVMATALYIAAILTYWSAP